MRHYGKRVFALLLALMLCLSLFPSALAEDAGSIAAADEPEQEINIAPEEEGDIIPAEEGSIAPANEGSIRPAGEGDALPRADETQDGETSGQCGDNLTWSFDGTTGTLSITGSGDMWDWSYPSYAPWYSLRASILSVELPRGLTSVGRLAFYDCSGLTGVTIPAGVTSIGDRAFSSCSGLIIVDIPNTVRLIDQSAFKNCSSISSLVIPGSVQTVGSGAFNNCSGLTSVVVMEGVESIMTSFQNCSKLSSISLPGSLTYLGSNEFYLCSELREVYFGGTIEAWKTLQLCYGRYKLTIHCSDGDIQPVPMEQCGDDLTWSFDTSSKALTITGSGKMWDWSANTTPWRGAPKSVELPLGLTNIGSFAFFDCTGLTTVDIPENVSRIGAYAFWGCSGMTSISIPASVSEINTDVFMNCTSLKDILYGGTEEAWGRLNLAYDRGGVTVHCVDGIIEPNPDTNRCGENLSWSLEDGILTITGTGEMWNFMTYKESSSSLTLSTAPWYSQRDTITHIRFSEGVTSIGNYAFSTYENATVSPTSCENLVSIELPETLKRIGTCGLAGFKNLKEIHLPASLEEIGSYGFQQCACTELELPQRLLKLGGGVFFSARIQRLTIPASVSDIGDVAFQYSSLKEICFLGDAPAISSTAFDGKTVTAYYPSNNSTWTQSVRRSYCGDITWVGYVPTGGTLSIGDMEAACIGRQFTVDLMLDENPGVMMLSFRLVYDDSVMEFLGAEDGVFCGWTVNAAKNALVWDSDRDQTETGTLLRLRFRVKDDAAPGLARIGISDLFAGNYSEEQLYFETSSGTVTLILHLAGDANNDGQVNGNDLIRLRKYLAGAEKKIIEGNADVNADAVVDLLDLVRMRKYFALEDVILE